MTTNSMLSTLAMPQLGVV